MNCQFHPEAEEEFLAAIDWYEEHERNLAIAIMVAASEGGSDVAMRRRRQFSNVVQVSG